jgi:hypothetical protein
VARLNQNIRALNASGFMDERILREKFGDLGRGCSNGVGGRAGASDNAVRAIDDSQSR